MIIIYEELSLKFTLNENPPSDWEKIVANEATKN